MPENPHDDQPWQRDEKWRAAEAKAAAREQKRVAPKEWAEAMAAKRQALAREPGAADPGELAAELLRKAGQPAVFLPASEAKGEAVAIEQPDEWQSFGFVGAFAEVRAEEAFAPGTLVVALQAGSMGVVAPETLRLFRADDEDGLLRPLAFSGLGRAGPYVWGQVVQPGRYAAVGLPLDPVLLRALRAVWSLRTLLELDPENGKALLECIAAFVAKAGAGLDATEPGVLQRLAAADLADGLPVIPFDWKGEQLDYAALAGRLRALDPGRVPLPEFALLSAATKGGPS